jgi:hypothetical protein
MRSLFALMKVNLPVSDHKRYNLASTTTYGRPNPVFVPFSLDKCRHRYTTSFAIIFSLYYISLQPSRTVANSRPFVFDLTDSISKGAPSIESGNIICLVPLKIGKCFMQANNSLRIFKPLISQLFLDRVKRHNYFSYYFIGFQMQRCFYKVKSQE